MRHCGCLRPNKSNSGKNTARELPESEIGCRDSNKSEMERRLSEIVSAETLTKCILFRALPSPGVTCFWTTAPIALGDCP